MQSVATRAEVVCLLLDIPVPAEVRQLTDPVTDSDSTDNDRSAGHDNSPDEPGKQQQDPASKLTQRAARLRTLSNQLLGTHASDRMVNEIALRMTAQAVTIVAHLLDAEAAAFNADTAGRASQSRRGHQASRSAHHTDTRSGTRQRPASEHRERTP